MPCRLIAFPDHEIDINTLEFEPDTVRYSGTELILPDDPTINLTAAAADQTDQTDDIITDTLLHADMHNDDDTAALEEVRNRLWFLADTGYDLRQELTS
jgi:hypothetical protein